MHLVHGQRGVRRRGFEAQADAYVVVSGEGRQIDLDQFVPGVAFQPFARGGPGGAAIGGYFHREARRRQPACAQAEEEADRGAVVVGKIDRRQVQRVIDARFAVGAIEQVDLGEGAVAARVVAEIAAAPWAACAVVGGRPAGRREFE